MISIRLMNKALTDLKEITGADLVLMDAAGTVLISASDRVIPDMPAPAQVLTAECEGGAAESGGWRFLRTAGDDGAELILAAYGEAGRMAARIGVSEIETLYAAAREKTDKNRFLESVMAGRLSEPAIHAEAARLRIREDIRRIVLLAEVSEAETETAMQVFRAVLSSSRAGGIIFSRDASHIAIVCEMRRQEQAEAEHLAHTLLDTLNAEAMIPVRIAVGMPAEELKDLRNSCEEARLALEVGRVFLPDRKVIRSDRLGIGRLIWQLPAALCVRFLEETFPDNVLEELDTETMTTVRRFFDCSLNISETARQLFVHRNTLVYRLERLEKRTGLDIRKFDDALTFRIAMLVHERLKLEEEGQVK